MFDLNEDRPSKRAESPPPETDTFGRPLRSKTVSPTRARYLGDEQNDMEGFENHVSKLFVRAQPNLGVGGARLSLHEFQEKFRSRQAERAEEAAVARPASVPLKRTSVPSSPPVMETPMSPDLDHVSVSQADLRTYYLENEESVIEEYRSQSKNKQSKQGRVPLLPARPMSAPPDKMYPVHDTRSPAPARLRESVARKVHHRAFVPFKSPLQQQQLYAFGYSGLQMNLTPEPGRKRCNHCRNGAIHSHDPISPEKRMLLRHLPPDLVASVPQQKMHHHCSDTGPGWSSNPPIVNESVFGRRIKPGSPLSSRSISTLAAMAAATPDDPMPHEMQLKLDSESYLAYKGKKPDVGVKVAMAEFEPLENPKAVVRSTMQNCADYPTSRLKFKPGGAGEGAAQRRHFAADPKTKNIPMPAPELEPAMKARTKEVSDIVNLLKATTPVVARRPASATARRATKGSVKTRPNSAGQARHYTIGDSVRRRAPGPSRGVDAGFGLGGAKVGMQRRESDVDLEDYERRGRVADVVHRMAE